MRPSTKPTGAVWRLLEQWQKNHPLRPNQSQMAGLFGVSTSLLSNWKFMESTMQADEMDVVSRSTGIDIALIARAVAEDKGNRGDSGGNTAANTRPGSVPDDERLLAVASGGSGGEDLAREAAEQAAEARAEQLAAIKEMKDKERDKGEPS